MYCGKQVKGSFSFLSLLFGRISLRRVDFRRSDRRSEMGFVSTVMGFFRIWSGNLNWTGN